MILGIIPLLPAIFAGAKFALDTAGKISEHKAQSRRAAANRRAAQEARKRAMGDLSIRSAQEARATGQRQELVRRQTAERVGSTQARSAASGVMATDLLIGDLKRSEGEALRILQENQLMTDLEIERQRAGVVAQQRARERGVPRPSTFGTALGIGAGALQLGADLNLFGTQNPTGTEITRSSNSDAVDVFFNPGRG